MIFPVLKERKGKLSPLCKSKAPGFHLFILFAYYRAFHFKKRRGDRQILHSHTGSFGLFLQHYLGGKSEEQALNRQYRKNTAEKNHQAATPVLGRGLGHPLPGYWFLFLLLQLWWAKSHFPACTSSTSSSSRGMWLQLTRGKKTAFQFHTKPTWEDQDIRSSSNSWVFLLRGIFMVLCFTGAFLPSSGFYIEK